MSRLFYHVMQDNVGNLLFDVSGTMRLAGSSTLATIYGDEALTVVLPNPMTNHPSFGSFKCFLGAGDYDFHMAKAGYTFETLTGVQGHGTMAQQDANAVAITAGNIGGSTVINTTGTLNVDGNTLVVDVVNNRVGVGIFAPIVGLDVFVQAYLRANVGVQAAPETAKALALNWARATQSGIVLHVTDSDSGGNPAIAFTTVGGTQIGSITTTGAATAYNTSSDRRLKEAIAPLTGALATVLALAPVQFGWKADGSVGQGFIAQDVINVVPQAVTGNPDDPEATMQMDHSKLVVWLVGACQELAARLAALEARLPA